MLLRRLLPYQACFRQYSTQITLSTKSAYTWGNGDLGRLGHGDESGEETRRNLEAMTTVLLESALGVSNAVVIQATPRRIPLLDGVVQVACGGAHTLYRTEDGQAACIIPRATPYPAAPGSPLLPNQRSLDPFDDAIPRPRC